MILSFLLWNVSYFVYKKLAVNVSDTLQVFPTRRELFERNFVNFLHHALMVVSNSYYALSNGLNNDSKYVKVMIWYQMYFYFNNIIEEYKGNRNDRLIYIIHHCVAWLLLYLSQSRGYLNYAIVVILLNDISDVFLCICKCIVHSEIPLRYIISRRRANIVQRFGKFFFLLFLVSFIIGRFCIYPVILLDFINKTSEEGYIVSLASSLIILNIYWIIKIVNLANDILT